MPNSTATSLVVIAAAAVIAPLIAELLKRWRIPSVLFELSLGIMVGPAVLGWVQVDELIGGLSQLGLAVLFFMAGYEIDFQKLRGAPINRGVTGWLVSLALGLGLALLLAHEGVVRSTLLVGLALTTTAIGTLLPMLRDRGMLETRFGGFLTAAGAVGEFGPILAITLLLSGSSPGTEALLLVLFAGLAVAVAVMASRPQPPALVEMLQRHLSTSTQLPVRIIMLLIVGLVVVATDLGLDNLLGAFAAGMIARLALSPEQTQALTPRLEAIGFGFLIPIFFIVSGVNFDLDALLDSTSTMLRVPMFLLMLLAVRGLPALLVYRGVLSTRERGSLVFLQATALPLLVVITEIGLSTDQMTTQNATALVGAGMLSVLIFPLVGFAMLGIERSSTADGDDATGSGARPAPGPEAFGEL
jgi:Kef-type K+ transport system membrane component KefB